jgi:hypothetical protein
LSLRSAEDIGEFAEEFISLEDYEQRFKELEDRLAQTQSDVGQRRSGFGVGGKA